MCEALIDDITLFSTSAAAVYVLADAHIPPHMAGGVIPGPVIAGKVSPPSVN